MTDTEFKIIYPEETYVVPPRVTVILDVPWSSLSSGDTVLLAKILGAVRLSLEAVRIVHQPALDLASWKEKPARILAFVKPPAGIAKYEVIQTDKTAMIISDSLAVLGGDEASKRKLWNALSALFQG